VTIGIVATVLFLAFEGMAVATVMPVAVADLGGLSWYAWGFSAFLITSLVGMVVAGDVADSRGPLLPFVASGVIFGLGLLVAGLAPTMAVFVVGRAVQGLGMGLSIVTMYVVVGRVYPDALRPRAFSAMSSAWVLPSIIGPAAAGWVAEAASWRWAFLGVVPFIVPSMLLVLPGLRGNTSAAGGRAMLDGSAPASGSAALPGSRRGRTRLALLAAVGVAGLQYAGQHLVVVSALAAVIAVALLWASVPRLLPAGTLRARRGLPTTVLMRGLLAGAFFGTEAFVPLMLVQERGMSPWAAGATLTGAALGWSAGSWYQGRPSTRVPRHLLIQTGCVLVAVSIVVAALAVLPQVSPWVGALGWIIGGTGMGLGMASVSVLVLEQSPPSDRGANSAAVQISDALLSTLLIGAGGVVFAALHRGAGLDKGVFILIDAIMLGVALVAVLLAPRVRAPLAAP